MRALVWVTEVGWEAAIDAARLLDPAAEITLLHVTPAEVEHAAAAPQRLLLGRPRRPPPPPPHHHHHPDVHAALGREAEAILAAAAARLGRPAATRTRSGRPEHEVLAEAEGHDVLVVSRDGAGHGPHSLAPWSRFVVDHARAAVVLASAP